MDENKELITILEVKENEFNINKDVDQLGIKGNFLRLGIICALGYEEGKDQVRMNIGFRVLYDEKQVVLFSYSIACDVAIAGWKEMSHKELDVRMNPAVEKLVDYCYAFMGGAMMKHTEGTVLKRFYLPLLDVKEFMPHLIVKELVVDK